MARIAVVRESDNVCINIIVADVSDPAPIGCLFLDIDNIACDIGWIYDPIIGDFVDPNPPPPEEGGE